jgi:hypothetical protein
LSSFGVGLLSDFRWISSKPFRKLPTASPSGSNTEWHTEKLAVAAPLRNGTETAAPGSETSEGLQGHQARALAELYCIAGRSLATVCLNQDGYAIMGCILQERYIPVIPPEPLQRLPWGSHCCMHYFPYLEPLTRQASRHNASLSTSLSPK